jgi:hypothetical protein
MENVGKCVLHLTLSTRSLALLHISFFFIYTTSLNFMHPLLLGILHICKILCTTILVFHYSYKDEISLGYM